MPWDNSNSQYGLLGVWSAAEAEVEIPASYWAMVDNHWVTSQRNNGTWDYGPPIVQNDTLAMTCAGLASLFVAHEYLDPPLMGGRVGRDPFGPAITRGLAWLEEGENPLKVGQAGEGFWGYNLYGVERVGLASGFKHLGKHDWYATLANQIVRAAARRPVARRGDQHVLRPAVPRPRPPPDRHGQAAVRRRQDNPRILGQPPA